MITFRLDLNIDSTSQIQTLLHRYGKFILTFETTNKSHFHGFLESTKSINTIRDALKRTFNIKGSQLSVAICKDKSKYIPYILKDNNLQYNSLFSDEELQSYRDTVIDYQSLHKGVSKSYFMRMLDAYLKTPHEQAQYIASWVFNYVRENPKELSHVILENYMFSLQFYRYENNNNLSNHPRFRKYQVYKPTLPDVFDFHPETFFLGK